MKPINTLSFLHRCLLFFLFASSVQGSPPSTPSVNIPWSEFSQLYRQSIERELKEKQKPAPPKPDFRITSTDYQLKLAPSTILGTATIEGQTHAGQPHIALFNSSVRITTIESSEGGYLYTKSGQTKFRATAADFQIKLSFSVPVEQASSNNMRVAFQGPESLITRLQFEEDARWTIKEAPGLLTQPGVFHLTHRGEVHFSYKPVSTRKQSKSFNPQKQLAISTTPVLQSVNAYVSFAESGGALHIIRIHAPPSEKELLIEKASGAQIWHVKTNDRPGKLYSANDKQWAVELDSEKPTQVEIAYLLDTAPLVLQGRLSFAIPAMNFPAQKVNVTVGLPPRLELLSLQGSCHPSDQVPVQLPPEFAGRPYAFTRSFHKGDILSLAIHYKEPVKDKNNS